MKNIPHGLNVGCSYEILSQPKVELKTAKVEGYITMGQGRTKVTIPMRSWVKNFIDRLHNILDGTGTDTEIATASFGASTAGGGASIYDKAGIILGTDYSTDPALTDSALGTQKTESQQCQYKSSYLTAPYASAQEIITRVSRLFTNASATGPWYIYEVGIKTKKTASTASNAGSILVARDVYKDGYLFDGLTDTRVDYSLKANLPTSGGPTLNLLRIFYNLFFKGSANQSQWVPRSGTITVSHAQASASSPLVVDGGTSKYYGIVVGYAKDADPSIVPTERTITTGDSTPDITGDESITSDRIGIYTTDMTYGANTVSTVVTGGKRASFYVTRDITNVTTSSKLIDRIQLLAKGNTAAPSGLNADMIPLCTNKLVDSSSGSESKIVLLPNQTLRVIYTFEITV